MNRARYILLLLALVVGTCGQWASAQQRVGVGARLPRLVGGDVVEWITDRPQLKGRALLLDFFHTNNQLCLERVDEVNRWADKLSEKLNVVVVTREPSEQVAPILMHEYQYCYVAIDERGVLFQRYEVPYVPYAVLMDHRGEVLWIGNASSLRLETIENLLTNE